MIIFEVIWHSVHWEVRFVFREENPLHGIEDFFSKLRLEHVVVLRFDVDNKLDVVGFRALGYSLDSSNWDLSLNLILFNVVESQISHQECSILLHTPSVDLDNNAGEDDLLTPLSIKLGNEFLITCTALKVLEFWFGGFHNLLRV